MNPKNLRFIIFSVSLVVSLLVMQGCLKQNESENQSSSQLNVTQDNPKTPTIIHCPSGALPKQEVSLSREKSPLPSQFVQLTPQQKEQAIKKALEKLEKGIFFNNVPPTMQANKPIIIEAGITQQKIPLELLGKGEVRTKDNVSYDPLSTEIKLNVNQDNFQVEELYTGKHPPITDCKSVVWKWRITPKQQGIYNIVLIAKIQVKITEVGKEYDKDIVVYQEPVTVNVNVAYSLQRFTANHWLDVLIGGTAVIFGMFAWNRACKVTKQKN